MLGRLFKQNTTNPQNTHHHPHHHHHHYHSHHTSVGNISNTVNQQIPDTPLLSPSGNYEDSYSREILYGTHNANQLKPYQFNNKLFRIIISQDGGNLRSKQVLYDSAVEPQSPPLPATQPVTMSTSSSNSTLVSPVKTKSLNTRNITTSKLYHNVSDLNDYMFGCGLPSNETHCNTKIHVLPQINNSVGAHDCTILITRLFSISDLELSEWSPLSSSLASQSNDWIPTPALPIKESNIKKYPFKHGKDNTTSKTNNFINSRFSIGVVIPLESVSSINDVIFNNWHEISHYLIILQKLVYRKLMVHLNSGFNYDNDSNITGCQFLVNKRIQFPNYILHGDFDINSQLYKLIKSIHYNFNLPKLINSNYLMKSSILNESHQYNPMLINWVLEILNWLEFKEGKQATANYNYNSSFLHSNSLLEYGMSNNNPNPNTNTFLASLLALLIPYRESLSTKPYFNVLGNCREVTRVIVMTGNPVVAKKLVFILNGMIPNNQKIEEVSNCTQMYDNTFEEESIVKQEKEQAFSISTSPAKSLSPMISTTNGILPIPIKQNTTTNETAASVFSRSGDSSSDNSLCVKWDIPNKSTASIPTTNKSRVETAAVGIPIVTTSSTNSTMTHQHSVQSKSSISYLSSSLNSSYSSSQSLYSLSKIGGSFMDKWKNSFGSFSSNPLTPTHGPNNNQNTGGYFDTGESTQQCGSLSKRNSIQSLRTPSPALEIDEFNWNPHSKPININNNSISSNLTHGIGINKLSRTQSMYDLYNMNSLMNVMNEETDSLDSLNESSQESTTLQPQPTTPMVSTPASPTTNTNPTNNTLEIKRTKTSVFTPLINDNLIKNVDEHNKSSIRSKCHAIMHMGKNRTKKSMDNEGTLEIKKVSDTDEDVVFKHKALLSSVAFSDEFRPEFSVQSCPINPKLEQQVMNTMKNDLLFYQNNCNYDTIITRTVFISLRAREIKLIEMNLQNPPLTNLSLNEGTMNGYGSSTTSNSYISDQHNSASRRNSTANSSYKTRIKKVYTPTKNLGNQELINQVEQVLDEINQLFTIQLQLFQDKKTKSSGIEFHNRLSKLVMSLLE